MINWRNIQEVGYPTDSSMKYFVSDGKDISTSNLSITKYVAGKPKFRWCGDNDTYENNSAFAGIKMLDMTPTHWCPVEELNLPYSSPKVALKLNYSYLCEQCGSVFLGHRDRVLCKECLNEQHNISDDHYTI